MTNATHAWEGKSGLRGSFPVTSCLGARLAALKTTVRACGQNKVLWLQPCAWHFPLPLGKTRVCSAPQWGGQTQYFT